MIKVPFVLRDNLLGDKQPVVVEIDQANGDERYALVSGASSKTLQNQSPRFAQSAQFPGSGHFGQRLGHVDQCGEKCADEIGNGCGSTADCQGF